MPRRLTALALSSLVVALAAVPARAQDHPLCKSLRAVGAEAKAAHAPVRITATVAGAALTCRPMADTPAVSAFCDQAVEAVSPEGGHMLPWRLRSCVDTLVAGATVETADQVVGPRGQKRIVHLAANMGGGVHLDLSQPATDPSRYDLVIWSLR
ncbi:MAG: hypothetical protein ACJ798_04550 [Phenylobacterium sp.]